jgi:hypothetical protein
MVESKITPHPANHVWEIRIRRYRDRDKKWEEIKPESNTPYYSLEIIRLMCHGTLFEDATIVSIQIVSKDKYKETHVYEQREGGL